MASKDPATRILSARQAALTRWGRLPSHDDREKATQPARDAALARFEREADPDGRLTETERVQAAEQLQRAHLMRMSMKAKAARARKRAAA